MEPDFTSSQQRKHKEQEDAVLNALAALGSAAQEDGENPDVDPLAPAAASSSTASSSTVLSSGTPSSDTPNVDTAESVETAESTNTTEPPEITDDTDFSTWTVDDYRAVKAEDLAKLPDDIPLAPEAEAKEVREAMYDVVDPELGVQTTVLMQLDYPYYRQLRCRYEFLHTFLIDIRGSTLAIAWAHRGRNAQGQ